MVRAAVISPTLSWPTWIEIQAGLRVARELPKFLPISRWSLGRLVERNARSIGDKPALVFLEEHYTWAQVNESANQYAHFLHGRGIRHGDVIALVMDNRPDFIFAQMGASKVGAITALINSNLSGKAFTHAINSAKPKLVLAGAEHVGVINSVRDQLQFNGGGVVVQVEAGASYGDLPSINAELAARPTTNLEGVRIRGKDVTSYVYTSGTTGLPKAAIITNQRCMSVAAMFARGMHELMESDVLYVSMPLYHTSAQSIGWGACALCGATLALRRKFSASDFWGDTHKYGATHFLYIGEFCRYLLNTPKSELERGHKIRVGVGNGLRPDIWKEFQERFGVALMREFYAATEGNVPLFNVAGRPGMVGRLPWGAVLIKCDLTTGEPIRNAAGFCEVVGQGSTGLLVARITPWAKFDGYLDKDATEKKILRDVLKHGDMYCNSGDLLAMHEDNWVAFADRVGDTFRWKGENVSTNEVGETLNGFPGVLESNVYGVIVFGAEGRAGMASMNVDDRFDLPGFAKYVQERLPVFMRPYFIRVQREMKITATLKHQKVDYREQGYDPNKIDDPVYYLSGDSYVPIDAALYARLMAGEIGPGVTKYR